MKQISIALLPLLLLTSCESQCHKDETDETRAFPPEQAVVRVVKRPLTKDEGTSLKNAFNAAAPGAHIDMSSQNGHYVFHPHDPAGPPETGKQIPLKNGKIEKSLVITPGTSY